MICKYCGKDIPDNDKFCMFCGKEVVDEDGFSVPDNSSEVSETIDFSEGWECGVCGSPITRGDKFCCSCSTPIAWEDEDSDPAAALAVRVNEGKESEEIKGFFDAAESSSKLKGDLAGGRMRKSSAGYGESRHFKKAGDL